MNLKMDSKQQIAIGGTLSTLGAVGIVFSALFGSSVLGHPLRVVSLFLVGVIAGLGIVLAIFGLYERRHNESNAEMHK